MLADDRRLFGPMHHIRLKRLPQSITPVCIAYAEKSPRPLGFGLNCTSSLHSQNGETHDETWTFWRCRRDPILRARKPCDGAAGDHRSRLLRPVLSERQLPEQRTGKSLYRRLPAPERLG